MFATDAIWECLIAQLCDVLDVHKAEQSVLCGDLSNRADKSILVKLWKFHLCGESICGGTANPEMCVCKRHLLDLKRSGKHMEREAKADF